MSQQVEQETRRVTAVLMKELGAEKESVLASWLAADLKHICEINGLNFYRVIEEGQAIWGEEVVAQRITRH